MEADPFAVAVRSIAIAHRGTKTLLQLSADKVAQGIRKNINAGRNASGKMPEGAPTWVAGTPMTPLSKATLMIREKNGISSTRPFYETGYTYDHIGGWLADAISVRVGGTTKKARQCISLNYGTEVMGSEMKGIREALKSEAPDSEIPPRNPVGYTKQTSDAIFGFWAKAMKVGDASHSTHRMDITLF